MKTKFTETLCLSSIRCAYITVFLMLTPMHTYIIGQTLPCITADPSPEHITFTINKMLELRADRFRSSTCIPIKAHVYRKDDGSEGITNKALVDGLSYLNIHYKAADIQFYYCGTPNYIDNTDLWDFSFDSLDLDTEAMLFSATTEASNAVNVFYVNRIGFNGGAACGYASFPNFDSPIINRIVIDNECVATYDNGTYPHEFGHYFNLFHTHQSSGSANAENVDRAGLNKNCELKGDLLCDTDADPRYNSSYFNSTTCQYTGNQTDLVGVTFTPPIDNIMSYFPDACGGIFTPEQIVRIKSGLTIRSGHTTYSFTCQPPPINNPSGLTAALNANQGTISLSWQDNANNEMGYIIERQIPGITDGFETLAGGTAENATSIEIPISDSNNTHKYRIKPANGDCSSYSNNVTIFVPLLYCSANASICDEYISNVVIESINNSSNCGNNGYQGHLSEITTLNQGDSYTISVTNGFGYNSDQCRLWVDWNNDKDFYDSGEEILVSGSPGIGPYTGNLIVPISAVLDTTVIRIRITYNEIPLPCGTTNFGETEDYSIIISNNSCDPNPIVTNAASSGAGSLAQALQDVCPGDTVIISNTLDGNALLFSDDMVISSNVCIMGNGPGQTIFSGNNLTRLFSINQNFELDLREMKLMDCNEISNGGAIYNQGTLLLKNVSFENNKENGQLKVLTNEGQIIILENGTVTVK